MEDPRDHYGAIDSSFYPPQDRNPRGYFGSQNYGPQSYDLQKPLLKYPTPDILESKGLSKTYTIPAARRRKTAQNQDTSNTEWERFLTDWDEGTLTLRLVHNSEYSVYKDGREKINLVCPSSSSDSSANTRPLQMRWLHLKRPCLRLDILKRLVLKMPFIAQELRQIAMTILEDIEKTSTAPAKDNGPRQQLVDTFRGIGRYDDHPLSETEPVIFLSSPYLALGEAIAHSGLDKDHGSVGLLQSLYGFDISSTQYTEEVIRKMKIGSSKDMIRIPQLWCLVIGSGLMITYSELSLTDLFGNLIHVDPNTSILEQPMNVRVEDEKQRQYNIVIDGKSSFVDFLQDAVALCRRPGTEVSDYELFIDSETKVTPQKWLDLVKTSHVEVVIFYVRFKGRYEGLRRAPHYMYDGYDMMPYGVPIPPPSPEVPSKPPLRRKALRRQQKNRQTNLVQATSIKERTVKPRSLSGHKIQHPPKSMQQVNRRQPRRPRRPRETVHTSAHKPTRINERVLNDVIIVRGKAQIFEGDSSTDDETKTPTTTNERAGLHDSNASQEQIGEDSSEESLVSSAEDSNLGETERPSNEELDLLRLTILPAETVSIQAMEHLDLPFYFSENKVVIQRLLSQEQIDELFRLGQEANLPSKNAISNPFFTWRPRNDHDGTEVSNSDSRAIRVLSRLHKLVIDGSLSHLYSQTSPCTMEDLLFRHEYLERKARNEEVDKDKSPGTSSIKESIASKELYDGESVDHQSPPSCISIEILKDSAQASVVSERQGHAAGEENVSEDNDGKGPSDVRDEWTKRVQVEDVEDDDTIFYATYARRPAIEAAPDSEAESINQTAHETRDSTEAYHGHETIVERLVEVSQELFWDFVPKQGSVPVHHVSKRFWGALDGILRQIAWSVVVTKKPTQWKIRESMRTTNKPGHSDSLTFSDCEACSTGATYQHCDAALEHLHSHHIHCPRTHIVGRPYDDPCFVWLEVSKQGKNEQKPTSLEDIELFLARLVEIRKTTHDLHCLVATAPHEERTTSAKLSLPMNLVYAFEEIINLFIMQGKQCSIITRVGNSQKHSEKITRMKERTEKAFLNIGDLLEASYADIILLSTKPRNLDILGLDHIGPEFIVGALVLSLQNRHLSRGEGTELLQVYRQYILKLRYQVSRRPQRRLFLEIDGLFEELEALFNLTNSQKKVLEDYRTLLAPASLRITTQLREKLFGIESQYIERQIKTLQDRINEIHQLRQQTASLRERVRQMIEILEEGHGRAIRVFTVVTLFFLPLSFTSSFFGMNTTDIRDIGYDQRVFWTVSIPVTAGILALAFIYAYKGDEIEDYITLAINSRKAKRAVQPKDEGHPARAETWFSMTSGVEEHSHDGHLDNGLNGWSRVGQRLRRKQGVAVSGETTRSMEV